MTERPAQLPLAIELIRESTLASYRPGPNAEAVAAVRALAEGSGESYLYLFGPAATGKTHLLQGSCRAADARGRTAQYLPLAHPGLTPAILEGLDETCDLIAIDDLQAIVGRTDWELALFALFNRARGGGRALLIAATLAPDALGIGLRDLVSRLHWGPRYRLLPLSDVECETLLIETAAGLGMRLDAATARYIMNNHARDPASLVALIERIDRASLREQRPPSIHLVRQVIRGAT